MPFLRGGEFVGDDIIQRLFNKIDNLSDRLARVETMLEEREKKQTNIAGIIAWIATTAIAIYGAVPK
jgi:hypothetical protein